MAGDTSPSPQAVLGPAGCPILVQIPATRLPLEEAFSSLGNRGHGRDKGRVTEKESDSPDRTVPVCPL